MVGTLERSITLELGRSGVQVRLPVRRGDSLVHRITVTLTSDGAKYSPSGAVLAQIYALLPDGSTVSCDGEILSDGTVTFIPGGGFFVHEGPVLCRLSLRGDDGGELYSPAFAFDVDGCFAAGAPNVPAEEYSRLEELLMRTLAAQAVCEDIADEMRKGDWYLTLTDIPPQMDGEASPGTSEEAARADHVHPTDTSRMPGFDLLETLIKYRDISEIDTIPMYINTAGDVRKVGINSLLNYMKLNLTRVKEAGTADIAKAMTDDIGMYTATLPPLSEDSAIALTSDIDAALAEFTAEEWIFELDDGSTVTKQVVTR